MKIKKICLILFIFLTTFIFADEIEELKKEVKSVNLEKEILLDKLNEQIKINGLQEKEIEIERDLKPFLDRIEDQKKRIDALEKKFTVGTKIIVSTDKQASLVYNIDQTYQGVREYYQDIYNNLKELVIIIGGATFLLIGFISLRNSHELKETKLEIREDTKQKIIIHEDKLNSLADEAVKKATQKVNTEFELYKKTLEELNIQREISLIEGYLAEENKPLLSGEFYPGRGKALEKAKELIRNFETYNQEVLNKFKGKIYFLEGKSYLIRNYHRDQEKIFDSYSNALANNFDDPDIYGYLGVSLFRTNKQDGIEMIERGVKKYENDLELKLLLLGYYLLNLDNRSIEKINELVSELVNEFPCIESYANVVIALYDNKLNENIEELKTLIEKIVDCKEKSINRSFYNKLNDIKEKLVEEKKTEIIDFIDSAIRKEVDDSTKKRDLNVLKSKLE